MRLEKVDTGETQPAEAVPTPVSTKDRKILYYRNPMNPTITSKTPAKDDMGMDYIPVYEDEAADTGSSNVQGRASFNLSQERQQLIGVTTAAASKRDMNYEVRASGTIAFDPDLYTAMEEYRQALISRNQMDAGPLRHQADELVNSARTKLRLMGLTDGQIKTLNAREGSPMNLLLPKGSVWVYAEIYEYELPGLKSGATMEVEAPSIPGKSFTGKVSSISPIVNSPTRTVRARALVPDPQGLLRPDTYVNVRLKVDLGERLTVPEGAVLHSGDQSFVFVQKEKGHFEPRVVRTGVKAQDFFEVLSGVQEGEIVVTSANFLIDSESRLRGVLQNSQTPSPAASPMKGAAR